MNGCFFRAKKSMNNNLCTAMEVEELIMQEEANQRTVGLVVNGDNCISVEEWIHRT